MTKKETIIKIGDMTIKGTEGEVQTFDTGCVRDVQEGKGRFDYISPHSFLDILNSEDVELIKEHTLHRCKELNKQEAREYLINELWKNLFYYQIFGRKSCDFIESALYHAMQIIELNINGALSEHTLTGEAMLMLAKLYEAGAVKYDAHNWTKGMPAQRCMDSCMRHLSKYCSNWIDEDHMTAVVWNICAIIHYEKMMPSMCGSYWQTLKQNTKEVTNEKIK